MTPAEINQRMQPWGDAEFRSFGVSAVRFPRGPDGCPPDFLPRVRRKVEWQQGRELERCSRCWRGYFQQAAANLNAATAKTADLFAA